MSAVDEYRNGTSDFNRDADSRILNEIAGPAHFVMHLADAAIAELEAELLDKECGVKHEENKNRELHARIAELEAENGRLTHLYDAESRVRKAMDKRAEQAEGRWNEYWGQHPECEKIYERLQQAEAEVKEHIEREYEQRQRARKAEAELAALKARRCAGCMSHTMCSVEATSNLGYDDHSFACNRWAEREKP